MQARWSLESQVLVASSHLLDSFSWQLCVSCLVLARGASSDWEIHGASGELIVQRIRWIVGRGRPMGHFVVKWKSMRVCRADCHHARVLRQNGSIGCRLLQTRACFDTLSQSMADNIDAVEANVDNELIQRSCHRKRAEDVLRADYRDLVRFCVRRWSEETVASFGDF